MALGSINWTAEQKVQITESQDFKSERRAISRNSVKSLWPGQNTDAFENRENWVGVGLENP